MEPKYVVIKRENWEQLTDLLYRLKFADELTRQDVLRLPIEKDFFVMVEGDVFAPAGALAYAANIEVAVELSSVLGLSDGIDPATVERLHDLADDLVTKANKWQSGMQKIPD